MEGEEEMSAIFDDRYSRQERFAALGVQGQKKLGASHVLIIGAGALGTSIAETLVRGGVGEITLADRDVVEWSNLQRQQLYSESDATSRLPKAVAAKARLEAINSTVKINIHVADIRRDELEELVKGVDLIMDGTDNFDTRLLINDMSQKHSIPWIYGGCVGSYGITYTFLPGTTPCLNCLIGSVPLGGDTCDTAGIIPQAVHMVTAHQTTEAFKYLSGNEEAMSNKLLTFDLWRNEFIQIGVGHAKKDDCLSCGQQPTYPYLSSSQLEKTDVLCGRDTVQIRPGRPRPIQLDKLEERLSRLEEGQVERNPFLVAYTIGDNRLVFFPDGRAFVHGTKDVAEARTLYHRYMG